MSPRSESLRERRERASVPMSAHRSHAHRFSLEGKTMAPTTSSAIEDEIITMETAYWDAMQQNDIDGARALTHDPCIVTGAQGAAVLDHAAMTKMYEEKIWTLKDYQIDNMNVQTL